MLLSDYQDIGGTTGALARRAEELYQSFNAEEQAATRQMFLRLVTLGEGSDDTRRRVLQSELLSLNRQSNAMPKIIQQLIKTGMVFTVEPGLYSPEVGGFRHSDTVVITDDGAEMITFYPRDLESLTLPI